MPRNKKTTHDKILDAANRLFYDEGIRAVSVDAISEKAGITKKTLYYHFKSKDDLIAAYLESRDQPNLLLFKRWFDEAEGSLADKINAIFQNLSQSAKHPKWKGCGFLRTAAELANMPGHPAIKVGASHKSKFEAWLQDILQEEKIKNASLVARQITIIMDGSFSAMLIHKNPEYIEAAGKAAQTLITQSK